MSRINHLLEALEGILKGVPGADSWLLQEEKGLVRELVEVYTTIGGDDGKRQLCGVTLGRMIQDDTMTSEGIELVRQRVGQLVLGSDSSPPSSPQAGSDIITLTGCDILGKIIQKSNGDSESQKILTHCMQPQPACKVPIIKRILSGSAPVLESSPHLVDAFHNIVVCPILNSSILNLLTVVRIAYHQNPRKRSELPTMLLGIVTGIVSQGAGSQMLSDFGLISDVMQLICISPASDCLHNASYELAAMALQIYTPNIARKVNNFRNDPSFGAAGVYSERIAIRSILNTISMMLTNTIIPTSLISIICQACVQAATLQETELEDVEPVDLSLAVDIPGDLRDAAAWCVSCLLKDADSGGPCSPIPGIGSEVSRILSSMITGTHSESTLFILQQLFEGNFLCVDDAPVDMILQVVQSTSLPATVRARACVAASAVVCGRLPADQHAFLINYQWCKLSEPSSTPIELRVMAALGCGTAVAHTVLNPDCLLLLQINNSTSLVPFLELVKQYPNLLLESLNRIIQILSRAVLTPANVAATLRVLLDIMEANIENTRLCQRLLSVLCKGLIEEHISSPDICQHITTVSTTLMSQLLSPDVNQTVQSLASSALDIASALCSCSCSCSSVAASLIKPICEYPAEGKSVIRSAAKSLALSVSVAKGGDETSFGLVIPSLLTKLSQKCDPQTAQSLAAAVVCASTFCSSLQLKELSVSCLQYVSCRCASAPDWTWPVLMCLPWCSLLSAGVPADECLRVVGSNPSEVQNFLACWITIDNIIEPKLRHISAKAAGILLNGLPGDMLSQNVMLLPIKTIYRRAPPTSQVSVSLCDALLVVLYRFAVIEQPLAPYSKSFLSGEFSCAVPGDSATVEREAHQLLSTIDQSKREQIHRLVYQLACRQP